MSPAAECILVPYIFPIWRIAVVVVVPHFVEVVFIQLSYETGEVAVLEVFRQYGLGELLVLETQRMFRLAKNSRPLRGPCAGYTATTYLQNHETVALIIPSHYRAICGVFEHPIVGAIRSVKESAGRGEELRGREWMGLSRGSFLTCRACAPVHTFLLASRPPSVAYPARARAGRWIQLTKSLEVFPPACCADSSPSGGMVSVVFLSPWFRFSGWVSSQQQVKQHERFAAAENEKKKE